MRQAGTRICTTKLLISTLPTVTQLPKYNTNIYQANYIAITSRRYGQDGLMKFKLKGKKEKKSGLNYTE